MKGFWMFSSLIALSLLSYGQTSCDCYERLHALGNYQYSQNQYQEAYKTFQKALTHKDTLLWTDDDYSTQAEIDMMAGNEVIAKQHLKSAVLYGGDIKDLRADTLFKNVLTPGFINELDGIAKEYKLSLNMDYLVALERLFGIDQAIRQDDAMHGWAIPAVFRTIDSTDFYELKKLVSQYGYPNKRMHGFETPAVAILFHASVTSDTLYSEALELLHDAYKKGYVNKAQEAQIIDRHREWVEHKGQKFGYWQPTRKALQLDDYMNVDSYRFQYNLLTFGDQCRMYHHVLPISYTPAPYPKNYFCDEH